MKKKALIIGGIIIILGAIAYYFIASSNTVVCSSDAPSGKIKIVQKYTLKYDKDVITNVTIYMKYTIDDKETYTSFGTVIDNTVASMASIENDYIDFSSKKATNYYSTTLKVAMKKVPETELETLGLNKSLKAFQKTLEEQGLECK